MGIDSDPDPRDIRVVVAHNLRRIRVRRGLGLTQLASRAGMAKGTLSKLESGSTNPTVSTLHRLSAALDVPLADLVTADETPAVDVVRAGEGLDLADSSMGTARLVKSTVHAGVVMEIHDMTFAPGQRVNSATHGAGSWEHVLVLEGTIEVGPLETPVELRAGDYAVYAADRPHEWHNRHSTPSRVWVTLVGVQADPRASA